MMKQRETATAPVAKTPMSLFERYLSVWVFLCIVVGIVLSALLVPILGAMGAAMASSAALLWWNIGSWRSARALLGVDSSFRATLASFARAPR